MSRSTFNSSENASLSFDVNESIGVSMKRRGGCNLPPPDQSGFKKMSVFPWLALVLTKSILQYVFWVNCQGIIYMHEKFFGKIFKSTPDWPKQTKNLFLISYKKPALRILFNKVTSYYFV